MFTSTRPVVSVISLECGVEVGRWTSAGPSGRMALPHVHQPGTDAAMTSAHIAGRLCRWFPALAEALDARSAPRLACLFLGAILARGRRTVTRWIRAAQLSQEFRPCYTTVSAAGKRSESVAARLIHAVVKPLLAGM